jgi:hypothetical protein
MFEESGVYISWIWHKLYILNNSTIFTLFIMMRTFSTILILHYNYLNIVIFVQVFFLYTLVGILSINNDL